jgi:hypothetical protein
LHAEAVDTGAKIGIDGSLRVDRRIAQPTTPAVAFAHFVQITHVLRLGDFPAYAGQNYEENHV